MRASSGDGGAGAGGVGGVDGVDGVGGVGGARDDAPLPRPFRVLAILYDLTYITPKVIRVSSRTFQIGCYLNLETGLGVSFLYLSVNRHYSIREIG
jgi:hypothetical protein